MLTSSFAPVIYVVAYADVLAFLIVSSSTTFETISMFVLP